MADFCEFKALYNAEFGYLDGEAAWEKWVMRDDVKWGYLHAAIKTLRETWQDRKGPRLYLVQKEFSKQLHASMASQGEAIPPEFLCSWCANSGKLWLIRDLVSDQFVEPKHFPKTDKLEIVTWPCACGYGARSATRFGGAHDKFKSENARKYAMLPSWEVYRRTADEYRILGKLPPAEEDMRLWFAQLKNDRNDWEVWCLATATAKIELCADVVKRENWKMAQNVAKTLAAA